MAAQPRQALAFLVGPQSHLAHLSLAHCKLKGEIVVFFDAVSDNTSLESLDVSGNQFGDVGTIGLAKGGHDGRTCRLLAFFLFAP